jgi:hypothetical protein
MVEGPGVLLVEKFEPKRSQLPILGLNDHLVDTHGIGKIGIVHIVPEKIG